MRILKAHRGDLKMRLQPELENSALKMVKQPSDSEKSSIKFTIY